MCNFFTIYFFIFLWLVCFCLNCHFLTIMIYIFFYHFLTCFPIIRPVPQLCSLFGILLYFFPHPFPVHSQENEGGEINGESPKNEEVNYLSRGKQLVDTTYGRFLWMVSVFLPLSLFFPNLVFDDSPYLKQLFFI